MTRRAMTGVVAAVMLGTPFGVAAAVWHDDARTRAAQTHAAEERKAEAKRQAFEVRKILQAQNAIVRGEGSKP